MADHSLERMILHRLDRLSSVQAEIATGQVEILRRITALEYNIAQGVTNMSKQLDDLTAQVAATTTVEQSAITLINGLAAQLKAAGTDPAALSALQAQLEASASALAAAVSANTPAAPAPAPAPAQ